METKDRHINFELITRYLAGEATTEEKLKFDSWIRENPASRELFNEFKKVWESLGKVQEMAGIDIQAEWKKLEEKINFAGSEKVITVTRTTKSTYRFYFTRIAAVLIIGLLISLTGIYIHRNTGYNTFRSTTETLVVELPDGSHVTLNAGSVMKSVKKYRKERREVKLTGEGYFEVMPDPEKPFFVYAGNIEIAVIGTSFNVNAYRENDLIEVVVNTGQVAVTKEGEMLERIILKPGNKGTYNKSDQSLNLALNQDPNYLSWKTKQFIFNNTTLEEVIETINKVYHSNILIMTDSLKQSRITSSFNNQSIDAILNVLKATLDIEVKSEEDKTELSIH